MEVVYACKTGHDSSVNPTAASAFPGILGILGIPGRQATLRKTRAGSVNNAQINCSTLLTANPTIRNGSRMSHTTGYSTSATMASGQHRTRRMHHNRNFVMAYRIGYGCRGREVQRKGGWSGRRDSNQRHQPWQGCTLPTELLPRRRISIVPRRDCACQFQLPAIQWVTPIREWYRASFRYICMSTCLKQFAVSLR